MITDSKQKPGTLINVFNVDLQKAPLRNGHPKSLCRRESTVCLGYRGLAGAVRLGRKESESFAKTIPKVACAGSDTTTLTDENGVIAMATDTPLVDIIIVNWNAGQHLRKCIESIDSPCVGKIIVIDNHSKDDSVASVEYRVGVTIIRASCNLGFSKACNHGARESTSEFLLFLNPDTVLHPETLRRSLCLMNKPESATIGICGVKLLDEEGNIARTCARFPSVVAFIAEAVGLHRIVPELGVKLTDWPHDHTRHVDHVIGAFFMVRRKVFEDLGGFDERFFVYLEDVDFSLRASMAGWKTIYLAEAQAFHAQGGCSRHAKGQRLFLSRQSRLIYACKHFSRPGCICVWAVTLTIEPLARLCGALLTMSADKYRETFQGYSLLWGWCFAQARSWMAN